MRRLILVTLGLALAATPALAATEKIYTYTPADEATRARTNDGLTFVFDKGLMSMRIKEVLSTQADAEADVRFADERELGAKLDKLLPANAPERELYAVEDKAQGPAMIRAFCPGSAKGWLVFSPLTPRKGAVVHVLGVDPVSGKARYCTTLRFDYHGEWKLPPHTNPTIANPLQPLFPGNFGG